MNKGWLSLFLLAVLIGGIFYINSNQTEVEIRDEKPLVGFMAPNFTLVDKDGNEVTLEQYRGKAVFVNFWASWCPPCKEEMPYIQEAYNEYGDEIVFLLVNVTPGDSKEAALNFMDLNNYDMPVLFDLDGSVSDLYRASSIPTSFFIDKDGIIKARHAGSMNYNQIETYINKALEE